MLACCLSTSHLGDDPCNMSFSAKRSLFEFRPSSCVPGVSKGDIDVDVLDDEEDSASVVLEQDKNLEILQLRERVQQLCEEREVIIDQFRISEHESLAKDDEIGYLQASLGALQGSLIEKNEELAWTKTQLQDMTVEFGILENNNSAIAEQLKEANLLISSQREAADVFETHPRDDSCHPDTDIEIPDHFLLSTQEVRRLQAASLASCVAFRCPSDLGDIQVQRLENLSQATVVHVPHVWDIENSRHMMHALKRELGPFFQQREVYWTNPVTKKVETRQEPRKTAFWAENDGFTYTYSERTNQSKPFTPLLRRLQQHCVPLCRAAGIETNDAFNVAFGNLYEKGHKIGFHSDDNEEIVCGTPIVSFSFGRSVCFEFADKVSDAALESIILESGDVVIMGPGCQQHYRHGVRQKLKPKHGNDFRLNITFRQQHKPLPVEAADGSGWSAMVVEASAVEFNRRSYVHSVQTFKDVSHDNKLIWNRMTRHLCKSPLCTMHYCYCGSRNPKNVGTKVLAAYLEEIENAEDIPDSALEV